MPDSVKAFLDTEDHTAEYDPQDIQNSTVMAVLSYLGLLVLIPWFAAPNSPYTRFHAKQGMTLLIVDIAYSVLSFLLMLIKVPHTQYVMGIPITYSATPLVYQRSGFPAVAAHSGAGCSGHRQRCSGKSQRTSHHWQAELD